MIQKNKQTLIWSINFLVVLGAISVNIYLPSLPSLKHSLSTSLNILKLSISLFLMGYALSQFFWGSISERFGRKKPILWGLFLACLGSIGAMIAPNVTVLNIARFIEGTGIGCATVLGRAILTDSFNRAEISRASAFMLISANIMPALAPILGGYLLLWFGWRSIFLFLVLYTLSVIILYSTKVEETHKNIKPNFAKLDALREYFHVFKNLEFVWYLLPYTLLSGGLIAYYAATPFIFVSVLHIAPYKYSFLSIGTVGTYILGAYLCQPLTRRIGYDNAILCGILISLLSGITLLAFWFFTSFNIATVLVPMMIFSFAVSIVAPNGNAGAMSALRHIAGAAAAVLGAAASGFAAMLSYIINLLDLASLGSLAGYITILSLLVLMLFFFLPHRKKQ